MTNLVFERFDTASAFVDAVSTRPANDFWKNRSRASRETGDSWYGTNTWEEASQLARVGYAEVVNRVKTASKKATSSLFERVETKPTRPCNGYVGGSPNVVRAMQGLPRDMRFVNRKPKKIQGITLVYERGATCNVSTDKMIEAGSRLVALMKLFERAQIPVRLIVSFASRECDEIATCEVVVKDFHAPMNLQKIAYYAAHPSAHRRLKFSWLETTQVCKENFSGGYGRSVSSSERDCKLMKEHYEKQGARWVCINDFDSDDTVIKVWEEING